MPIKYNLTKYDMLFSKIKRASLKKDRKEMTHDEIGSMLKAVIVASFASGHSWQTYKAITAPPPVKFNSPDMKKEHQSALSTQWKNITPFDIHEVANMNVQESTFSAWLFFNVDRSAHDEFMKAWMELRCEFDEDCDNVERATYVR